jgi:hypothetical protein
MVQLKALLVPVGAAVPGPDQRTGTLAVTRTGAGSAFGLIGCAEAEEEEEETRGEAG